MSGLKTEYEVERIFIEQLDNEQGYSYIDMANYDDVLANFRVQFCKVNAKALIEAKGVAELSDSEFDKILLRLDNHTIYESAKILREKWVLELDNGKTIYAEFLTSDMDRNTYQVTHQVTMDKAHKNDVEYKNRYDYLKEPSTKFFRSSFGTNRAEAFRRRAERGNQSNQPLPYLFFQGLIPLHSGVRCIEQCTDEILCKCQ